MNTLKQWVEALATGEFSSTRLKKVAEALRTAFPGAEVRSSRRPSILLRDYVRSQLSALYSDYRFWEQVSKSAPPEDLCDFVRARYGIRLPAIPSEVWSETVAQPDLREKLLDQLAARYADLLPGSDPEGRTELLAKGLMDIIDLYVTHPHASKARILKGLDLSANALEALERAGQHLAIDARQCREGNTDTRMTVRGRRGAPVDLERRQDVEGMVKLLRERPDATNHEIAKFYFPQRTIIERCGETQTAKEAKLLAHFREGLPVKSHTDDSGIGRRPSRKAKRI